MGDGTAGLVSVDNRSVVLEISRIELAHVGALVTQFLDLLQQPRQGIGDDPAIDRLVPDAYADDPEAAREFRRLTEGDLLARRADDARTVLASLDAEGALPVGTDLDDPRVTEMTTVRLDSATLRAWLRTLTALRLVLAERLGIASETDHDEDADFGIYEWLGYRLDTLVRAASGDE